MGKVFVTGFVSLAVLIGIATYVGLSWWMFFPGTIILFLLMSADRKLLLVRNERLAEAERLLKLAANIELAPLDVKTGLPDQKGMTREDIIEQIKQHTNVN